MGWFAWFLFWVIFVLLLFKLWVKLTTGWCTSNTSLVGKTAIITGANTGIGYETAEESAKRGAKVILACRDEKKGREAVEKIIQETDNNNVVYKNLDVSSFKSVRQFVEDIKSSEERLDILINNAGVGNQGREKSAEGNLMLMQTNHFGPFLLTNLLLDLLKKTPNSRIVNVASLAANHVKNFNVNALNDCAEGPKEESRLYLRSKLCNVLFTIELAKRLRDTTVTAYSLHPGVVHTSIFKSIPNPVMRNIVDQTLNWFFKNAKEGAQTSIYCAVAKGIEDLSGEHFEDCHYVYRYKTARDPELPGKLWAVSEKLSGLKSK